MLLYIVLVLLCHVRHFPLIPTAAVGVGLLLCACNPFSWYGTHARQRHLVDCPIKQEEAIQVLPASVLSNAQQVIDLLVMTDSVAYPVLLSTLRCCHGWPTAKVHSASSAL
jgi:hypothetical protein